jgi:hypothetical protein
MFGDVQAVDAGFVGCLRKHDALVKEGCERPFAVFDVVEESDFHGAPALVETDRISIAQADGGSKWVGAGLLRCPREAAM